MKPLDPRLLAEARAAKRYVIGQALLGFAVTACVVVQAFAIGHAVSPVIDGRARLADVSHLITVFAIAVLARVVLSWAQERWAHRSAAAVIGQLRARLLDHASRLGPRWLSRHGAEVVSLATRGLDDLEPYVVRYLPQLLLAATLTPAVLVVIFSLDLLAALTIAFTIPLIPLFMWLVGLATQEFAASRIQTLERQGSQLMDLLAGLTTLRALGRELGPGKRVRRLSEQYRGTTMATLRVAFLSSAVLEFLATLSVALVAVGIGLRLVEGELDLTTGLIVLVLAPEVYFPLRAVGQHFHASADGLAAVERTFAVLDEPAPARGGAAAPRDWEAIEIQGLGVRAGDREYWAPCELDAVVLPGQILALAGPSGSGKTTTAMALLGLQTADRGGVWLRAREGSQTALDDVDLDDWWTQVTWVGQRPTFAAGTIAEYLASAVTTEAAHTLAEAARATGLDAVVASLPHGWQTPLVNSGVGFGIGLSVGQSQRLALTRALIERSRLVVLDEPTAHLDSGGEADVLTAVRALADAGSAVVVVAHRSTTLAAADVVVHLAGVSA